MHCYDEGQEMLEQLQRTTEWHNARVGKLTASRVGAALGINPWQKPDDLIRAMVREYHGAEPEFVGNVATQWGQNHEPLAVLDFMSETGNAVEEVGFYVHPEHEWIGASPDGFVGDDALIEIKCPFSLRNGGAFKSITEQPHYHAQIQVQLAVTDRNTCYFYQWAPHGTKTEVVGFNHDWWAENLPRLHEFYQRYLEELDNPAHLAERNQVINGKRYEELLARYDELRCIQDNARAEQKEILDALVEAAGGTSAEICGRKLTRVERKGSVSYAKVVKDHLPDIDLEPYRGEPSASWRLT